MYGLMNHVKNVGFRRYLTVEGSVVSADPCARCIATLYSFLLMKGPIGLLEFLEGFLEGVVRPKAAQSACFVGFFPGPMYLYRTYKLSLQAVLSQLV